MGVPVVTWSGRTIISRLAASCLASLDLTQFIAPDLAGYIDIALKATQNLDALAALRATLRDRLQHSAIGDPVRYARAVEAAYRQAWQEYCAKAEARA
jgi:predicted O-linked N-acetylglucosamine transferase (SPINDLY family)